MAAYHQKEYNEEIFLYISAELASTLHHNNMKKRALFSMEKRMEIDSLERTTPESEWTAEYQFGVGKTMVSAVVTEILMVLHWLSGTVAVGFKQLQFQNSAADIDVTIWCCGQAQEYINRKGGDYQ